MPINKKSWKDDQGNYRLASLTSVPGKVMEEIILSTIPQHRQNNCGIKPSHIVIYKGRSYLTKLIFCEKVAHLDEGRV